MNAQVAVVNFMRSAFHRWGIVYALLTVAETWIALSLFDPRRDLAAVLLALLAGHVLNLGFVSILEFVNRVRGDRLKRERRDIRL